MCSPFNPPEPMVNRFSGQRGKVVLADHDIPKQQKGTKSLSPLQIEERTQNQLLVETVSLSCGGFCDGWGNGKKVVGQSKKSNNQHPCRSLSSFLSFYLLVLWVSFHLSRSEPSSTSCRLQVVGISCVVPSFLDPLLDLRSHTFLVLLSTPVINFTWLEVTPVSFSVHVVITRIRCTFVQAILVFIGMHMPTLIIETVSSFTLPFTIIFALLFFMMRG